MPPIKASSAFKTLPNSECDPSFRDRAEAILEDLLVDRDRFFKSWEAEYGRPFPRTYADWSRLTMAATGDSNLSRSLQFSPAEMQPIIEGFLLRHKLMEPRKKTTKKGKPGRKSKHEADEALLSEYENQKKVNPSLTQIDFADSKTMNADTLSKAFKRARERRKQLKK